jgi:hypothetical protein
MILAQLEQQPQLPEEQTYQARLRAAAAGSVAESDAAAIVAGIVERAKKGDRHAIDQFFTHVLGANTRPTKVVNQLVVPDVETAARIGKR